jgi:hypothetical protein
VPEIDEVDGKGRPLWIGDIVVVLAVSHDDVPAAFCALAGQAVRIGIDDPVGSTPRST